MAEIVTRQQLREWMAYVCDVDAYGDGVGRGPTGGLVAEFVWGLAARRSRVRKWGRRERGRSRCGFGGAGSRNFD
jgi:hypothetical protein